MRLQYQFILKVCLSVHILFVNFHLCIVLVRQGGTKTLFCYVGLQINNNNNK